MFGQEPLERKLGYTTRTVNKKSRPYVERKWDVPFLSSLHQILSDKFILDEVCQIIVRKMIIYYTYGMQVLNGHRQDHNLLGDYCDGSVYNSHPLFSKDPTALQIILYYDDAEVCNPLGSSAKKHKLGEPGISIRIQNPTHYCSI